MIYSGIIICPLVMTDIANGKITIEIVDFYPLKNVAFRKIQSLDDHIDFHIPKPLTDLTGWWFWTWLLFSHWECRHPNWLSYFSEGWLNHQPANFCVVQWLINGLLIWYLSIYIWFIWMFMGCSEMRFSELIYGWSISDTQINYR